MDLDNSLRIILLIASGPEALIVALWSLAGKGLAS